MRKLVSLLLAIIMVLGIASVGAFAEGEAKNSITWTVGLNPNLDPHRNQGMEGYYVQVLMYEGLYRYTKTGIEMAGCDEVTVSDDGLTWTFHLREDEFWNDGQPVTADDYVFSFRRLVDPEILTPYAIDYGQFLLNGVEVANGELPVEELGVTAIDDYTLEVKLAAVCSYFDALLCYSTFYPIRSEIVDDKTLNDEGKISSDWAYDVEKSITNGPMKMVYCDEEQKLVFERNEYYWDADSVLTDEVVVLCVDDTNTNLALFRNGDVDLTFKFPSEESTTLMDEGYFHAATALGTGFLLVNCQEGAPTADPLVRQALSLCIDREFLADVLLSGVKEPATTFIGSGFPGATADGDFKSGSTDLLTYDPDKARELLAEAGYPGGEGLVLECPYPNTVADYVIVFEYLQATWQEELGITVVITSMESSAWGTARENCDFDLTVQNWYADYFDASNMLSIFVTDHSINQGHYSSEKFDSLFQASLVEADNAERVKLMHEAEEVLIGEDMGIIPLYHNKKVFIYSDDVLSNVEFNADAFPDWVYIIKK